MRSHTSRTWLATAFAIVLAAGSASTWQDIGPHTVEEIETMLHSLEGSTVESDVVVAEVYRQALVALKAAAESRVRTQKSKAETAEVPAFLATLKAELAQPAVEPELVADPALTLQEMDARLQQSLADLSASRGLVTELDNLATFRATRTGELPKETAAAQQALSVAQEALDSTPLGSETASRRTLLLCQIDEARSRSTALEAERETYEARRELLPLRRDRALRRQGTAEKVAAFWKKQVDERRTAEGEAAAKQASRQLKDIDAHFPALADLAKSNKLLTGMRSGESGLPQRITLAQAEVLNTEQLLAETNRRFKAAGRRIQVGGLTEGMGLILRRDYEWLLRVQEPRSAQIERQKKLSNAQLEQIPIEEERFQVGGIDAALEELLSSIDLEAPSEEFVAAARGLLEVRRGAQDAALEDLAVLSTAFYRQKDLSNQLQESIQAYRSFIEKRILWVRSAPPNPLGSLVALPANLGAIVKEGQRVSLFRSLWKSAQNNLLDCTLIGLLFVALAAGRGALERRRSGFGSMVRSYRTDRYHFTLRALAITLLLALPLPLILWTLGWLWAASDGELASALGHGLRESAGVWLAFSFLGGLLVERGVGQAHFKWPMASLAAVRRELRWLEPVAVVCTLVVKTLESQSTTEWSESLGRICFAVMMLTLAWCSHRLLRAESELWPAAPKTAKGLLGRTHRIWSITSTGLPLVLTVLALLGYYYTALQFELRLRESIVFAILLVLVNALLLRWLFMARRRLAVNQAIDLRARRVEEQAASGSSEAGPSPVDDDKVDIPNVDAHTRQLFKSSLTMAAMVGLYLIWASVLPAIQGLDRIQLLPSLQLVETESDMINFEVAPSVAIPEETGTAPAQAAAALPILTPGAALVSSPAPGATAAHSMRSILTLADLLLALVFVALTSVAARNLPALLELALLQRLPLDSGSRYAVSTIVRYLILITGVSAISGALGIGWQKVQWLAAALTFGLAFGLQEIFANFVSGIIILIERPIRVGDIVTVGETEGRVTQLRMRATTIQDRDRRELLIPNKEFITGSVVNWTLTDSVTRIVLQVGIAYGSDTARARALLLELAGKHSLVLADPPPQAIFRSFGDSSLNFELRVFLGNRDHWPEVTDELHTKIDAAFRKARIEIAFPQRDIHVRSLPNPTPDVK